MSAQCNSARRAPLCMRATMGENTLRTKLKTKVRPAAGYIWPIILPPAIATASFIAAVNHDLVRFYWSATGVLLMLIQAALSVTKETQKRRIRHAMKMRLAEACRPFVVAMCQVSAAVDHDRRQADVRTLISGAVAAARAECGNGARANYRSCLYSLTENELLLVSFDGRPGMAEPRKKFDSEDPIEERKLDAALAIKTARGANVLFVEDLHENPPRSITNPEGRSYRTMLVAPVNAGGRHFGFFSIDSPEPKTFSEADLRFVLLIASIIAAALIQVYKDGYVLTEDAEFIPRSKAGTT